MSLNQRRASTRARRPEPTNHPSNPAKARFTPQQAEDSSASQISIPIHLAVVPKVPSCAISGRIHLHPSQFSQAPCSCELQFTPTSTANGHNYPWPQTATIFHRQGSSAKVSTSERTQLRRAKPPGNNRTRKNPPPQPSEGPGSPHSKQWKPPQPERQCNSTSDSPQKYCAIPFWNETPLSPSHAPWPLEVQITPRHTDSNVDPGQTKGARPKPCPFRTPPNSLLIEVLHQHLLIVRAQIRPHPHMPHNRPRDPR
jgi:hypothetical protein